MKLLLVSSKRNFALLLVFILVGCSSNSWVSNFVKYNGVIYSVTDESVDVDEVGDKLGEVKYFHDTESDTQNFSSNYYPVGTEIYAIDGVNADEAISIKDKDGNYIKLSSVLPGYK